MESSAAATAFPFASCSGIGGAGGRAGWEADAATAFGVVGWALLLFELLGIPEVVVSGDRNTNREGQRRRRRQQQRRKFAARGSYNPS